MLVKCPVCQAEYELEPGKYKCECGAKFFVLEDGGVTLSDPGTIAGNYRTNVVDSDRTMAPQTQHDQSQSADPSFDPERTVPNIRIRHERGELQTGDVILGRYELLEKLGSGAMGVVFKCRDRISGVEYALKMVPPELVRDAEAMEDVRENFKLVHGLKHQNIASMDFLDRDEYGSYFLIMEYVRGESLTQWIKKKWRSGRPDAAEIIHIVNQIASALDYAHSQQILHRDIKPANIMVDEKGNVKVLDFGLASKIRSTMTALSVTTSNTSGTPHYLSPEQFKGKYPGPASDQYALGVLTYQMFAGHLPFEADDFNVLHAAVINEEPDPIEGLPTVIELAIQRVLRKDPKRRFENCMAFANALNGEVRTIHSRIRTSSIRSKTIVTQPVDEVNPMNMGRRISFIDRAKWGMIIIAGIIGLFIISSIIQSKHQENGADRNFGNMNFSKTASGQKSRIETNQNLEQKSKIEIDKELGFEFSANGKTLLKAPKNIENYEIPNGVTSIEKDAFSYCESLKRITIPSSVTSIGAEAFYRCGSLISITLPYGVTRIENSTFSGCSSLISVTIPDSVVHIGYHAFLGCKSLETIMIPNRIKTIDQAFIDCTSLKSVTIPNSVTTIWVDAFKNCKSLKSIVIPNSVTIIAEEAFAGCSSLTSITIPASVTRIGLDAFKGAGCEEQAKRDYPHLFK